MKPALLFLIAVAYLPAQVSAQEPPVKHDWFGRDHYRAENSALAGKPIKVIFFGDSITSNWAKLDPDFFSSGYVNRGIPGQTTAQMLGRFRQDVINLHPEIVHIMAGTNDVAGNSGAGTQEDTISNIESMVDIATVNKVRVVLASIPPSTRFSWHPLVTDGGARIVDLNIWMKAYAASKHIQYVDYWSALHFNGNDLNAEYTHDGTHPNKSGYIVMERIVKSNLPNNYR